MFKPGLSVKNCPICKAPLTQHDIDQFGVPVGYSAACDHCFKYNDIWVNGLRQVQCGEWESPDYESEYGSMSEEEIRIEKQVLKDLNKHIWIERIKYRYQHHKEKRLYGEEFFNN